MKRKSIFIGLVCIVVVIAGFLFFNQNTATTKKVTISADYPKYDSLENLVDKADTIIKGKITGFTYTELNVAQENQSDNELLNPGGEKDSSTIPYTVYDVEIEKTYKGTVKEKDTIQIKTLGGIIGDTEYVLEDSSDTGLEEGKQYVLFLETYSDSPASLLNPAQASYEYEDDGNIITNQQGRQTAQNGINFKIEDLENIINSNK
jgi:hypothetical protein